MKEPIDRNLPTLYNKVDVNKEILDLHYLINVDTNISTNVVSKEKTLCRPDF